MRQACFGLGALSSITYPIVLRLSGDLGPNGDWARYVDEYDGYGGPNTPSWPGIAIVDKAGKFSAVRAYPGGNANLHKEVDWAVKTIDALLGGRQPIQVALALDRSGTMSELPPSGGSVSKIDILKDAVNVFFDVWEAHTVIGDKVAVVDFSDSVSQYAQSGSGAVLVPLGPNAISVRSYVGSLIGGGWTCMGGAIAQALDTVQAGRRHIILFSDGMQNYNPVLADVDSGSIQILKVAPADAGNFQLLDGIFGDSGVPPKPGKNLRDFDTRIHAIGVGLPGPPWSDLMSRIAGETGGLHFETPAPLADLQSFYINALLDAFAGATPQLVQHSQGVFDPQTRPPEELCRLNGTAQWLTLVLSWEGDPDRNRLECCLEAPDGTLIEIASRTRSAPKRCVVSMPLPTFHYNRLVSQVGCWRLHILGVTSAPTAYQVFWIVDDAQVHFSIDRIRTPCHVGQLAHLTAKLDYRGGPVSALQIQDAVVRLAAPTTDIQQFLRTYRADSSVLRRLKADASFRELPSEMALKLRALSLDKEAVAQCTRMEQKNLPLAIEKGRFTTSVRLEKSGIHRFDFQVKALDHHGHLVTRSRTLNLWVAPRTRAIHGPTRTPSTKRTP